MTVDEMDRVIDQITAQERAQARARRRDEFKSFDRSKLSRMSDKDLAEWQAGFEPTEPQWRLAEHEWQSRLIAKQIRAAHWQAWFGIAAAVIGALVGTLLTLLVQLLAR
jgi:hypothetical protein